MDECIFCKIVRGEIPANEVYRDEQMVAFHDISPAAPTHILFIPTKHIVNVADLSEQDGALIGEIHLRIAKVAAEQNLADFRVVTSNGAEAGQSVMHLHFHLLGGRRMTWPPG